jgi:four helix bundle protein
MSYKFERLEVWQMAVEYIDMIYKLAEVLPRNEEYNLRSQIVRAATSSALNIARARPGKAMPSRTAFWVWHYGR